MMTMVKAMDGEPPFPQTAIVLQVGSKAAGSYIRRCLMRPSAAYAPVRDAQATNAEGTPNLKTNLNMITRYTKPEKLVEEFNQDRERALYWQKKKAKQMNIQSPDFESLMSTFYHRRDEKRSESIDYLSPKTGNSWLLWWKFKSRGYNVYPEVRDFQICYQLTDPYMTVMIASIMQGMDGVMRRGVTIFTSHLFMRLSQRLGVSMDDRKLVIKNFVEEVAESVLDIREPRDGEKYKQVICRLPKSWIRGHYIYVKGSYLIRFNTYYTDGSLTYAQRKDLKSFARFADAFGSKAEIKEYFSGENNEDDQV